MCVYFCIVAIVVITTELSSGSVASF